jgi:soluble lytic murein transglycosylase
MSPPAATVTARRSSRHRAAVRRRRLWLASFVGVAAVAALIALAMPLFRKAVNDLSLPLAYASVIREQAAEKHLDPALIAAVIYAETKFEPRTSSAGAEGLMQILPRTAEYLAQRSGATTFTIADLASPEVNIAYGSYYLRYLLDRYDGREMLALAAYNGGETNVDRWLGSEQQEGRPLTVSEIPFPQTQAYVGKVMRAQRQYRQTYASELGYS